MINEEIWVVVITYNGEKWIQRNISSLLNQTYPFIKIFIVDNNSSDNTTSTVQKFVNKHNNIFLYKSDKNLGYGGGANIILRKALKANIRWVLVLNQDIILEPNCIELLINSALEYPQYGLITPLQLSYEGNKVDETMLWIIKQQAELISDAMLNNLKKIYSVSFVVGAAMFMRCEALREVGLFDEIFWLYGEDNDLCRRFKLFNWELGLAPYAKVCHWHSDKIQTEYSHFIFVRRRIADYILILKNPTRNVLINIFYFLVALLWFPLKYTDKKHPFKKFIGCLQAGIYVFSKSFFILKKRSTEIKQAKNKLK